MPDDTPPPPPWIKIGAKVIAQPRFEPLHDEGVVVNSASVSLLFDNFSVKLGEINNDTALSGSTISGFELPAEIASNDEFLGWWIVFNGTCLKAENTRVSLTGIIGGLPVSHVIGLGEAKEGGWTLSVFAEEHRINKDAGPPVLPLPAIHGQLTLTAQRLNTADKAWITLEAISIQAIRTK